MAAAISHPSCETFCIVAGPLPTKAYPGYPLTMPEVQPKMLNKHREKRYSHKTSISLGFTVELVEVIDTILMFTMHGMNPLWLIVLSEDILTADDGYI